MAHIFIPPHPFYRSHKTLLVLFVCLECVTNRHILQIIGYILLLCVHLFASKWIELGAESEIAVDVTRYSLTIVKKTTRKCDENRSEIQMKRFQIGLYRYNGCNLFSKNGKKYLISQQFPSNQNDFQCPFENLTCCRCWREIPMLSYKSHEFESHLKNPFLVRLNKFITAYDINIVERCISNALSQPTHTLSLGLEFINENRNPFMF